MGPKLLYSRQCTSFTMNQTKTNSHFLPMEKNFFSSSRFAAPCPRSCSAARMALLRMEAGARQQRVHTRASRTSRGGSAQSQGWRRGEAAGGACVHPFASYNNPQQLPAALHRDPTTRLQMSPLPIAAIQLPPPIPLLPEGREAEQEHKQGLISPMLTQHHATNPGQGS